MSDNHEANMAVVRMNPWNPETNLVTLRVIGKMGEEHGEVGKLLGRITCQGFKEHDPVTHKSNALELLKEMADQEATFELALRYLDFCAMTPEEARAFMNERRDQKLLQFEEWFNHDNLQLAL